MNMYILGLKYLKSHAKRAIYLSIIIVFSLVSLVSMSIATKSQTKIAISICTLFVLPAKISELDLKYMSRLGLAYSF